MTNVFFENVLCDGVQNSKSDFSENSVEANKKFNFDFFQVLNYIGSERQLITSITVNYFGLLQPFTRFPITPRLKETAILNESYTSQFNVSRLKYKPKPTKETTQLAEVIFKCKRKQIFKNVKNLKIVDGEFVVVEVENGLDLGTVSASGEAAQEKLKANHNNHNVDCKIIRHATREDFDKYIRNLENDLVVVQKTKDLIQKYEFDMKITEAEWQFDHQRLTIYFTAPTRIDFRELVKDLARAFKTRIELRQISTREEAKRMGGLGSCGRNLCCSSFACEFCHVTLEHAKTQQLSNNVAKLSGYCGRLKCCLLYEYDNYVESFKKYPPMNSQIVMPEGMGRIVKADVFKDLFHIYIENVGLYKTLTLAEVDDLIKAGRVVFPKVEDT
ncbi:MAG: regulatory iron-sulfur-containing complex subunit RicT, partial [FCB group bacterium]